MMHLLYPYAYVDSVFAIDYEKLQNKGIKAIIFDIDNTLAHHGKDSTPEVDAFLLDLQKTGMKLFLLSDNDDERIERFLKNIGKIPYISEAGKPAPDAFLKAVEQLGVNKDEVVVIGDQIFMDILGANRAGLPCILVKFMRYPEETNFGKRRAAEDKILSVYNKSKKYKDRLGDILID